VIRCLFVVASAKFVFYFSNLSVIAVSKIEAMPHIFRYFVFHRRPPYLFLLIMLYSTIFLRPLNEYLLLLIDRNGCFFKI
jgi:hypothetical protein